MKKEREREREKEREDEKERRGSVIACLATIKKTSQIFFCLIFLYYSYIAAKESELLLKT